MTKRDDVHKNKKSFVSTHQVQLPARLKVLQCTENKRNDEHENIEENFFAHHVNQAKETPPPQTHRHYLLLS